MDDKFQKKLRIRNGQILSAENPPIDFVQKLESFHNSISIKTGIKGKSDHLFLFIKSRVELEKKLKKSEDALKERGMLWVCYQKKSSKINSDIDRDSGWRILSKSKLRPVSFIAIDETWTAFGLRNEPAAVRVKKKSGLELLEEKYIDKENRTVSCPEDLETILKKNQTARQNFDNLSFTNKKEYIVWILGAKKEETRKARIVKTAAYLGEGRKNPAGK